MSDKSFPMLDKTDNEAIFVQQRTPSVEQNRRQFIVGSFVINVLR